MNFRKLGTAYERAAAGYLESIGYEMVRASYRCPIGEIDLIARDGECLVFIEVKYRAGKGQGGSLAAVNKKKQAVIEKVAAYFLMAECQSMDVSCRFDVVGIDGNEIHHVKNAFEAKGYY